MYERKCLIFHVRILENCKLLASETATYQCSYIHSRDGVLSLASGNSALHNNHFSVEEATILLDLAAKSGNISWTVSATTKFIPIVSASGIVELENTQEAANQCIPSLSFDVKKDSSLALNHHSVVCVQHKIAQARPKNAKH